MPGGGEFTGSHSSNRDPTYTGTSGLPSPEAPEFAHQSRDVLSSRGDEVEIAWRGGSNTGSVRVRERDVHVRGGVIEPTGPDEIVASEVISTLDERLPRAGRRRCGPGLDLVQLGIRHRIIHAVTIGTPRRPEAALTPLSIRPGCRTRRDGRTTLGYQPRAWC